MATSVSRAQPVNANPPVAIQRNRESFIHSFADSFDDLYDSHCDKSTKNKSVAWWKLSVNFTKTAVIHHPFGLEKSKSSQEIGLRVANLFYWRFYNVIEKLEQEQCKTLIKLFIAAIEPNYSSPTLRDPASSLASKVSTCMRKAKESKLQFDTRLTFAGSRTPTFTIEQVIFKSPASVQSDQQYLTWKRSDVDIDVSNSYAQFTQNLTEQLAGQEGFSPTSMISHFAEPFNLPENVQLPEPPEVGQLNLLANKLIQLTKRAFSTVNNHKERAATVMVASSALVVFAKYGGLKSQGGTGSRGWNQVLEEIFKLRGSIYDVAH